jgi:hypothetical protein
MPIFVPLLRPLAGFDVCVLVFEAKILEDEEVEVGVEVGVEVDCDEVDVVDDTPIVARSVTPSLRLQHVALDVPQHQDPSLHCPTVTSVVGSPPS